MALLLYMGESVNAGQRSIVRRKVGVPFLIERLACHPLIFPRDKGLLLLWGSSPIGGVIIADSPEVT